ncbi:SEL1-like repeat protein [Neisseria subflava]|uniref:SEL1-like repeat protein n=1 Tax=Neisseria TaxID=482 RepID=UPI001E6439E9|nr:hypothetical protein [Neisseria subflava]
MGYCYENGVGTAKDMTQAVHWYQKSAARGDHNSVRDCRRRRLRRHVVHAVRRHTRYPLLHTDG